MQILLCSGINGPFAVVMLTPFKTIKSPDEKT
jgi:hypothetical protein